MIRRLVLVGDGAGDVGRRLLADTAAWAPGTVAVVAPGLGGEPPAPGVDIRVADPADPSNYPDGTESVLIAIGPDRLSETCRRVRDRFPAATVTACRPTGADGVDLDPVDRVVDVRSTLRDAFLSVSTGERANRLQRLKRVLRSVGEPLAVVAHDNPDPDAIGSALALVSIAGTVGVDAVPCYGGEISHQENRAMVNLLDLDLSRIDEDDADRFGGFALVDHSRAGVNDSLPPDTPIDIVLDHHPPREPVEARFVDLRPDVGATSTLLADYLDAYGIDPQPAVATALLFGIRVDTRDFTREVGRHDFEAAASLLPAVDTDALGRIESPTLRADVLDALARAVSNRRVRGRVLSASAGRVREKDALAQAADHLLGMAGVDVVVINGIVDGVVHLSGRARGGSVDLGETLREAFGQIGSAGGHADMAGGQLPLGILETIDDDDNALVDAVDEVVSTRFFEALETAPSAPTGGDAVDLAVEFSLEDDGRPGSGG